MRYGDEPGLSQGREPCGRCGQLVSTRVVNCPRCGHRLREPAVVPRMAVERDGPVIPVASAAPSDLVATLPETTRPETPAGQVAPVLEYRTPAPPEKPAKETSGGGKNRGYLALAMLLALAAKVWVASERSSTRPPPPAPRPVNIPPRININPQVTPGPGRIGPWTSPGGGRFEPGYPYDVGAPRSPGAPFTVDSRGRLVDRDTGAPVSPGMDARRNDPASQ